MKDEVLLLLLSLAIIFAVATVTVIVYAVKIHRKTKVLRLSRKLKLVNELTERYYFHPVKSMYYLTMDCNSKSQFDRANLVDFLCHRIYDNMDKINAMIQCSFDNKKRLDSFEKDYRIIMNIDTTEDKVLYHDYKYFKAIEKKLCVNAKPNPSTEFSVNVKKEYVSPKGRNSYLSDYTFSMKDVIACYKKEETVLKQHNEAYYQRKLMNDSIRYDVMKRDGFRCVLCGASSLDDGVKLHVDHILPVAKGGKTEMSNLRTLCERCNLGKGAKYDPDGLN